MGNSLMILLPGAVLVTSLMSVGPSAGADVQGSWTSAMLQIDSHYDPFQIFDADAATGARAASASVSYESVYGASTFSIPVLTPETAEIRFDIYLGATQGTGHIGSPTYFGNFAFVYYHAPVDTVMNYSYVYDYLGHEPSGLELLHILVKQGLPWPTQAPTWTTWQQITWAGHLYPWDPVHFDGSGTYLLEAGKDYTFAICSNPSYVGPFMFLEPRESHALVSLQFHCPADFNRDGLVNSADLLAFLNAFVAGDPQADCTGDGLMNTSDLLCFLNLFTTGC